MSKIKILAVAAGFAAAAGVTTAGTIYVNGQNVGSYDGNVTITGTGDIRFPSTTTINGATDGGGDGGSTCAQDQDATISGCQEAPWNACEHTTTQGSDIDMWTPGCQEDSGGSDTGGGGTGGGDTGGVPADCTGVGVGNNWTRNLDYTSFSSFPPTGGLRNEYSLRKNEYFSIKFTVPSPSDSWGLVGWDLRPGATNAQQTYAFSRCPGDFAEKVSGTYCKKGNTASGSLYFASSDSTYGGASWLCTLQAGQTYYLNIAYGQGTTNSSFTNTCPDSSCGAYFDWKTN